MSVAAYAYLRPSELSGDGLALQTSGGIRANPRFFQGFVTAPQEVAQGLLAVADVARTRYFQPMERAFRDPVVTGSRETLRFESFSGCCGVYARMDVLASGLDGQTPEHGTTNVDVNSPLRLALTRVRGLDPLHLAVGPDDLTVSTMDGAVVERKVPLPGRWLRGFAEVPVIASAMEPRVTVDAAEFGRFLRTLPNNRSTLWVLPSGRSLRLTSRPTSGAVCVSGPGRLIALRGLLRFATTLTAYGPAVHAGSGPQASTWVLESRTIRLSLTLSPQPHRGFSGEGSVLSGLIGDAVNDDADLVSGILAWDPTIDVDALALATDLPHDRVRAALTLLGTAGRVGYDVAEAAYFHPVMPFGTEAAVKLNPRLGNARELVAAGHVRLSDGVAYVDSADATYQVRTDGGQPIGCTCHWWAKYRGERGPCKHQLAVAISLGSLSAVDA